MAIKSKPSTLNKVFQPWIEQWRKTLLWELGLLVILLVVVGLGLYSISANSTATTAATEQEKADGNQTTDSTITMDWILNDLKYNRANKIYCGVPLLVYTLIELFLILLMTWCKGHKKMPFRLLFFIWGVAGILLFLTLVPTLIYCVVIFGLGGFIKLQVMILQILLLTKIYALYQFTKTTVEFSRLCEHKREVQEARECWKNYLKQSRPFYRQMMQLPMPILYDLDAGGRVYEC